ncbi:hypothetical protein, partial [Mesorhizobium sp. M3A.F.Ca.ET.174.01.1.1]|uniref:hypothetical protein n=1 Tax=Mesorhizobium sp. M3A.F.Ca.ET.174.01.1.1 TaxID=2563944 RepID=UPI001AEDCD82
EHLFDESGAAHGDGPEGVWNRLASRYWDDPDVSVSWTDAHTLVRRRGVTLDANATVKVASFGGETLVDPHSGERARPLSVRTRPLLSTTSALWRERCQPPPADGPVRT